MQFTTIYPDSGTDWLVTECPEIGPASQGKTEALELNFETHPQASKRTAIRHFELTHAGAAHCLRH